VNCELDPWRYLSVVALGWRKSRGEEELLEECQFPMVHHPPTLRVTIDQYFCAVKSQYEYVIKVRTSLSEGQVTIVEGHYKSR
jgi:hypothetical protein